jgi:membrane-associated phospholipid phosphatase
MSDASLLNPVEHKNGLLGGMKNWFASSRATGLHPALMRRHWLLWSLISGFLALQIPLFIFGPFSFDRGNGTMLLILFGLCLSVSTLVLLRYKDPIIGHMISGFGLLTALSIGGVGFSYFAAATNMPLQDTLFMRMDQAIGFDWMSHMRWVTAETYRVQVGVFAYASLTEQCYFIIPAMVLARRFHDMQIFLFAWLISISLTLIVFAILPGVSVFQHLDILAEMKQLLPRSGGFTHAGDIEAARAHLPIKIYEAPQGMIPFPSFHACGATLLLWAYWQVPFVRWPMAILNLLMIASTPVVGSHYLVDVIAGVALAIAAITLSQRLMPEVK